MNKLLEKIVASGVVVAVSTFLGYLLSFVYTMSYLDSFGIPSMFVTIDTNTVISFSVYVLSLLSISTLLIAGILGWIPYKEKNYFKPTIDALVLSLVFCILGYFLQLFQSLSIFPFLIALFLVLIGFIVQIIQLYKKHPDCKGFIEKYHAANSIVQYSGRTSQPEDSSLNYFSLVPKSLNIIFAFLAALYFLIAIANGLGTSAANNQRTFLESATLPGYLLISTSSDTAILAQYNNEFTRQFIVTPKDSLGALHEININK